MSMNTVRITLVALMVGLLGSTAAPAAQAGTGSLLYSCSGPSFGDEPSYAFQAVIDSDVPAALPYGSARVTSWTAELVAPDSFRSWAASQGFATLYAGARLGTSLDGVAQLQNYQSSGALTVPASVGPWTWTLTSTTDLAASALGHHTFTLTSLEITVAFHDENGPRLATSATCSLDPSVPATDTILDAFDVVAATTSTGLTVKGDTATATVTSNGAAPAGTATFSVGSKTVTAAVVAGSVPMGAVTGKATAQLPSLAPGTYTVSAHFVPTVASQFVGSTGTASYTAPPMTTKSLASARYQPALTLIKARTRVTTPDGTSVSGPVTFILKRNGKPIKNATLRLSSTSVASKKFRGITRSGRYLVVAKYQGTGKFDPSVDRVRLTLR
jgi:hypothetical protein